MAPTLSGKDKAARVPLGYYDKTGAGRRRLAWGIFGVLLLLALGVGVFGYWKQASSPGPIHSVHAAWENDCATCHKPLAPTGSGNGLGQMFGSRGKASDPLCMECHMGLDEQKHSVREKDVEVEACASCHRDHLGRSAFISRVQDAKCTCCHSDLKSHVNDGKDLLYAGKITSFERDHPEFKVLSGNGKREPLGQATDPGHLRFNHELHLKAGLEVDWTFENIKDEKMRDRYMQMQEKLTGTKPKKTDYMKLDCASCHVLDQSNDLGREGTPRAAADYMLPITYEQHCRACHPLTFSTQVPDTEIPHKLQPSQVTEFLTGVFTDQLLKDKDVRARVLSDRPLPGANLPREQLEKWKKTAGDFKGEVGKQVNKAEKAIFAIDRDNPRKALEEARKVLFDGNVERASQFVFLGKATCGLCHFYVDAKIPPTKFEPDSIPDIWFQHAKFNHRSHRAMKCAECHVNVEETVKDGKKVPGSRTEKDVLVPGIYNCKQCHSSARTQGGVKMGGVRQDCVKCHRYHHGDVPLAGRGAAARGVADSKRLDALQWLKGK